MEPENNDVVVGVSVDGFSVGLVGKVSDIMDDRSVEGSDVVDVSFG